MSKITQLELLVKKARKKGGNKILLELDFAKMLVEEIKELQAQEVEPEVCEVPDEIVMDSGRIHIELQGGRFKDD